MRAFLRLGLRAQIVWALAIVFALSFWLVGYAALQLTRRSASMHAAHEHKLVARTLAAAVAHDASDAELHALCDELRLRISLAGFTLQRGARSFVCGQLDAKAVNVPLAGGGRLQLSLPPPRSNENTAFSDLLLFYITFTGLSVLLMSYVALTYLTVRPIERITLSAAQLSSGGEHQFVPVQGSAEAAELARTFNEMALMLRAERKRLVDRLAELERTTSELASKEQQLIHGEKLASIGRLAAGVAHEIGNPLAAILGLTELLRDGELEPAQAREFLARIHAETERINGIIRDLLDFARRDAAPEGPQQSADLRQVIDDAVSLVRPQKESKDVEIVVQFEPGLPRVLGPAHRLTQVVLNLLLNAIDALGGHGKVELSVSSAGDGKHALLRVTDDGPGIAPEMRDKLFDPFTTTKPAGKGTGLGLAVSHAIVDSLSGTITAGNREQGGAWFEVRLKQSALAPSEAGART